MKKIPKDLDEGTIRRIDWFELIPAVQLPRALRVATGFHPMWAATMGVLLSVFLAFVLNGFVFNTAHQDDFGTNGMLETEEGAVYQIGSEPERFPAGGIGILSDFSPGDTLALTWGPPTAHKSFTGMIFLSDTVIQFIPLKATFAGNVRSFLWMILMIALWTVIGGSITRKAALQFTIGQHERTSHVCRFLGQNWQSYFGALAIPVCGLILCFIGLLIGSLLFKIPLVNYIVAIFFPILLILGFAISILGIGLLFAWPLMFAAVSVDGSDAFDAVSRSYSYVYQRPLHYLFYLLVAILIGMIGWFFIAWFIDLATFIAVSECRVPPLTFAALQSPEGAKILQKLTFPQQIILCWSWCFQLTKVGFLFSYFWASTTQIYLLLRRSVDGTPFDQVKLGKNNKTAEPLPPIQQDEAGAPELAK